MVAAGLADYTVVLAGGDEASGLADLLHQYLAQSVAESARKRAQAQRLRGEVVFRAAEDEAVCVRVVFRGDRIELCDEPPGRAGASVCGDFLSLAHLASGQASPLRLVARGALRLSCPARALPFLLRVLHFLRLEPQGAGRPRRWLLYLILLAAALGVAGWWWFVTGT